MNSQIKILAFFISIVFVHFALLTKSQHQIKFRQLTNEDGLSQNTVNSIIQDHKGFMWFGTDDGLNKFNGYDFNVYRNQSYNKKSISNNIVFVIYEDSRKRLWIGTLGGGLNLYDRQHDNFICYRNIKNESNSLINNFVRAIKEDSKGNLWIGTYGGFSKFNTDENTFVNYRHNEKDTNSLVNDYVWTIEEDYQGYLWIGTDAGISRFDPKNETFLNLSRTENCINCISHESVWKIYESTDSTLWFSTKNGFNKLNPESLNFTNYIVDDKYSNIFLPIYEQNQNYLWLGTLGGGLKKFNRKNHTFETYTYNINDPYCLNDKIVKSIYQDKSGVLWIGTWNGGINQYNHISDNFKHYYAKRYSDNSLTNNAVTCILATPKELWIGTQGGGLNFYNKKTGKFKRYDTENSTISNNNIFALLMPYENKLWLGTYDGLNVLNLKSGEISQFATKYNDPKALSYSYITCLFADSDNNVWIGTEWGLNLYNKNTNTFRQFIANPNDKKTLRHSSIRAITEDSNKQIWIGTEKGLSIFDRKSGNFKNFLHDANDPKSLSNDNIRCIFSDSKNRLWIGTAGGGLNLFVNGKFSRFYKEDGLPNNVILAIQEDSNGNLWISSNKGLSRFNPESGIFRNYNKSDGLQSNQFLSSSSTKDKNGIMYFGGVNGFNEFKPENVKDNQLPPMVEITGFKIHNKPVSIGKSDNNRVILEKAISETQKISLSHKDNVISFEFAALHYINPNKNKYKYMLENFDPNWIYTTAKRRYVTYTNLDAGTYTFKVMAANCDGIWSNTSRSIEIEIQPPYWSALWFKLLVFFLLTGLIVLTYYTRVNQIEYQKKALARTVENRTKTILQQKDEIAKQRDEVARAYSNIKLLSQIGYEITSHLSIGSIINLVYKNINQLLDVPVFAIGIWDKKNGNLDFTGAKQEHNTIPPYKISLDKKAESLAILCFYEQREIFISHFSEEYKKYIPAYKKRSDIRITQSIIYLPMNVKEKKIGTITAQSYRVNAYNESHVTVLRNIAAYAAIALENASSYIKIEKQAGILKSINQELESQKEKIRQQAEELKEINLDVLNKNEELKNHRKHLEKLVEARTKDLRIAKDKAEKSDRLKSAFLANMSHEIRTPMNAILGFSSLLTNTEISDKEREEYYSFIENSGKTLLNLIDDIIDISKIEADEIKINKEPCKIGAVISELYVAFYDSIKKQEEEIELIVEIPKEYQRLVVVTDTVRFRQIITNLLSNAIKYTEKGQVKLGYQVFAKDEEAEAKQLFTDKIKFDYDYPLYTIIFVEDTGIGIPKEKIDLIFNRFTKIEDNRVKLYRGAGLGLAISKKLAELLGGNIFVESEIDKGTIFYFVLGVDFSDRKFDYEHNLRNTVVPSVTKGIESRITILVVEDEDINFRFISAVLSKLNVVIIRASTGSEAIKIAKDNSGIELILMDINLPEIDGYEATREIKKMYPKIPVIAQTAYAMSDEIEMSYASGCNDYIAKPYKANELLTLVCKYI